MPRLLYALTLLVACGDSLSALQGPSPSQPPSLTDPTPITSTSTLQLDISDPCVNPCTPRARASTDIERVLYSADGWALGSSSDPTNDFALTYEFSVLGDRQIRAVGLDAIGREVASDSVWVRVTEPAPEVCYPGPSGSWETCLPVTREGVGSYGYDYPDPLDSQYRQPVAYLDLERVDPSTSVAKHFVLSEFAESWKGRYGIVAPRAVAALQKIRSSVGAITVNSGYRNPAYNASVGGATWSRHQYGDAFDLDPSSVSLSTLASRCWSQGAGYVELYTSHVHCDWRSTSLEPLFYGSSMTLPPELYEPEHLDAEIQWDGELLHAPAEGFDEGEPLRIWRSYDASGTLFEEEITQTFAPGPRARLVEVEVGGVLLREIAL